MSYFSILAQKIVDKEKLTRKEIRYLKKVCKTAKSPKVKRTCIVYYKGKKKK